jgi:hypothetical protein
LGREGVSKNKIILLGMCNPHSNNPAHALYPKPVNCTGHRVWKMINDRNRMMTPAQYIDEFDRRNLVQGKWSVERAQRAVPKFVRSVGGRTIVVFGKAIWPLIGAHFYPDPVPGEEVDVQDRTYLTRWLFLPHPSGRCLWYNDEKNREFAADLILGLWRGAR